MHRVLCVFLLVSVLGERIAPKLKWGQDVPSLFFQVKVKCTAEDPGPSLSIDRFQLNCGNHTLDFALREDILMDPSDSSCKILPRAVSCKLKKRNRRLWDRLTVEEGGTVGFGSIDFDNWPEPKKEVAPEIAYTLPSNAAAVPEMNSTQIQLLVAQGTMVVVDVLYPWCGACSEYQKPFIEVARQSDSNDGLVFAWLDASKDRKFARSFNATCADDEVATSSGAADDDNDAAAAAAAASAADAQAAKIGKSEACVLHILKRSEAPVRMLLAPNSNELGFSRGGQHLSARISAYTLPLISSVTAKDVESFVSVARIRRVDAVIGYNMQASVVDLNEGSEGGYYEQCFRTTALNMREQFAFGSTDTTDASNDGTPYLKIYFTPEEAASVPEGGTTIQIASESTTIQFSPLPSTGEAAAPTAAAVSACSLDLWRELKSASLPVMEYTPNLYYEYNRLALPLLLVFLGAEAGYSDEIADEKLQKQLTSVLQLHSIYKGRVATAFVKVPVGKGAKPALSHVQAMMKDFGFGQEGSEMTFPRVCLASSLYPDASRYVYDGGYASSDGDSSSGDGAASQGNSTVEQFVAGVLEQLESGTDSTNSDAVMKSHYMSQPVHNSYSDWVEKGSGAAAVEYAGSPKRVGEVKVLVHSVLEHELDVLVHSAATTASDESTAVNNTEVLVGVLARRYCSAMTEGVGHTADAISQRQRQRKRQRHRHKVEVLTKQIADVLKGVAGILPATFDAETNYPDPRYFPVKQSANSTVRRDEGAMGLYFFTSSASVKGKGKGKDKAKEGGEEAKGDADGTCTVEPRVSGTHYKGALKMKDVLKWLKRRSSSVRDGWDRCYIEGCVTIKSALARLARKKDDDKDERGRVAEAKEKAIAAAEKEDLTYQYGLFDGVVKQVYTKGIEGEGPPVEGAQVVVHYTGSLEDGTQFCSSLKVGRVCLHVQHAPSPHRSFVCVFFQADPLVVRLGNKNGIECWDRALSTMLKHEGAMITCDGKFAKTAPPGAKVDLIPFGAKVKYDLYLVDFKA
jgi:FKBP-type peptidyl-prolyl cis-trans isomerase